MIFHYFISLQIVQSHLYMVVIFSFCDYVILFSNPQIFCYPLTFTSLDILHINLLFAYVSSLFHIFHNKSTSFKFPLSFLLTLIFYMFFPLNKSIKLSLCICCAQPWVTKIFFNFTFQFLPFPRFYSIIKREGGRLACLWNRIRWYISRLFCSTAKKVRMSGIFLLYAR